MNQEEINKIVKKRKNFEYQFLRRPADVEDFNRSIEYEIKLEQLRNLRKKKAGVKEVLESDFSITQRIFFIYQRGTMCFPENIEFWQKFIKYCVSINSSKELDKIFSK